MKLTNNEKNAVVNAVKGFNEKTGLDLNEKIMVRIISSYDKTDNMSKRAIKYIGGLAVKGLKNGTISDVSNLGAEYLMMLEEIGKNTSLGDIRNASQSGDEAYEGFLNGVFGPKKKLMFKYDSLALKLGKELEKNGVSQDVTTKCERELNKDLASTANYIYDVKNGNETTYTSLNLRDDLKAIAPSYMAAKTLYSKKNFLQKWFTPSGWFLRNTIKTIEGNLKEANELLGVHTSIKTDEIPELLKKSAETEALDTGLKDAFLTAENRRVMIEIDEVTKEECNDEDLIVEPVRNPEESFSSDDEMEYQFA